MTPQFTYTKYILFHQKPHWCTYNMYTSSMYALMNKLDLIKRIGFYFIVYTVIHVQDNGTDDNII